MGYTADDIKKLRERNGGSSSSLSSVTPKYTADSIRKIRLAGSTPSFEEFDRGRSVISDSFGSWQDAQTMDTNKAIVSDSWQKLMNFKNNGDFTKEQSDYLDSLNETYMNALNSWDKTKDLYSYYQNADAFSKAMEKQKELANKKSVFDEKYAGLSKNSDFAEKSVINAKNPNAEGIKTALWSKEEKDAYKNSLYMLDPIVSSKNDGFMFGDLDEEKQKLGAYIYNTQGKDAYVEYMSDIAPDVQRDLYETDAANYAEWSKKHPILSTAADVVGTVALNPGTLMQNVVGKINPYVGFNKYTNILNEGQQAVSEDMGDVGAFLYNTGVSILESAAGKYLGGVYTVTMGGNAFTQTYKSAIERGLDEDHAKLTALSAGVAESLFEVLSLEKFKGLQAANVNARKTILSNFLKQSFTEGSEEFFTDISNALTDWLINGGESEYNQNKQEYIDRGFSEDESSRMAAWDFAKQLGESFLGGAISGGVTGGIASIHGYNTNAKIGEGINPTMYANAMESFDHESDIYKKYTADLEKYGSDFSNATSKEARADIGSTFTSAYQENAEDFESLRKEAKKAAFKNAFSKEATNDDALNQKRDEYVEKALKLNASMKNEDVSSIEEGANDIKDENLKKLYTEYYNGQDVGRYDNAFRLIQAYAQSGYEASDIYDGVEDILTKAQVSNIYNTARLSYVESNAVVNRNVRSVDEKWGKQFKKAGTFDASAIKNVNLSSTEKRMVQLFQLFSKMGMNIRVISDASDTSSNGTYNNNSNMITVNLKARYTKEFRSKDAGGQYAVSTFAHESTHWMENILGDEFGTFKDMLKNYAGEKQWNNWMAEEYKRDNSLSTEALESEVIARMCEDMLNNPDTIDRIIAVTDESTVKKLIARIRQWFNEIKADIKKLMEGYSSDSEEARWLAESLESFKAVQDLWVDMFQKALVTQQTLTEEGTKLESEDKLNNVVTEDTVQFSVKTYENGGKEFMDKFLDHQVAIGQLDVTDANSIREQLEKMVDLSKEFAMNPNYVDFREWQKTDALKDAFGNWVTAIVSNGDYDYNIDFSTVCKKRKALDKVLSGLIKGGLFDSYSPSEACITDLIAAIKENGFEVACALCFVDAKRYRVGKWATNYLNGFTNDNGKYNIGYNEMVRKLAKIEGVKAKNFDFLNRDLASMRKMDGTLDTIELSDKGREYLEGIMKENKAGTNNNTKAKTLLENPSLRKIVAPAEIISSVGLDAIRVEEPMLFDLIKASSGSATPKLSLSEIAFTNEVAKDFLKLDAEKQKAARDDLRKVGGYRVQSFSDYMGNMILDYVQLISNFSACRFASHAYTKEYFFVKLFGMTGMKINMSVVPDSVTDELKKKFKDVVDSKIDQKKYDSIRDEYLYYKAHAGLAKCSAEEADYYDEEDKSYWKYITVDESFPLDKAMEIQKDSRYNKNCGIIWVGVSSAHIRALLRDNNVPMVIPYHKSNINPGVAHVRGIAMYNDYTNVQSARIKNAKGEIVNLTQKSDSARYAILKSFNFYDALDEAEREWTKDSDKSIPQMAADKYLKMCDENGIIPAFDEFRYEDNYYKLLEDFRLYDGEGNYAKQQTVTMTFPSDFADIAKESLDETADTSNDFTKKQKQLMKIAKDIVEEHKKEDSLKSSKVDADGNALSDDVVKRNKDSKIRDDSGLLLPMYHGTRSGMVYKFDKSMSDDRRSFFFTDNPEVARTYSGSSHVVEAIKTDSINEANDWIHRNIDEQITIKKEGNAYVAYYESEIIDRDGNPSSQYHEEGRAAKLTVLIEDIQNKYGSQALNEKVYLNIVNPLIIDAQGFKWNGIPRDFGNAFEVNKLKMIELSQRVDSWFGIDNLIESQGNMYGGVDYLFSGDYDFEDGSADDLFTEAEKNTLYNLAEYFDKKYEEMGAEDFENALLDSKGVWNTRQIAEYAEENGYDGVFIKNVVDNGPKYKTQGTSNVAIAFKANQIKSVANTNPTDNEDIRFNKKIWSDTENKGEVRFGKFKNSLNLAERDDVNDQIRDEIRTHKKNNESLDFSGICSTIKHIVFYESYDDINPEIVGTRTWKEIHRYAASSTWIDSYIDEIASKTRIFRGDDREAVIKLAESVGVRGYDSILHGKAENRSGNNGESKLYSNKVDDNDFFGVNKQLQKENEKLKKDVMRLARRLKLEGQITKGKMLDDSQLELAAKRILRNANKSEYPISDLILDLRNVYGYILDNSSEEGKEIDWDELMGMAYNVAMKVNKQSKPLKAEDSTYKGILTEMRKARIKLTDEQIQEAKNAYGDDWRREYLGKTVLTKDGRSLDSYWSEWASQYPWLFNENTNPNDQITEFLEVYDVLKEGLVRYEDLMDDFAIRETAMDIYNKFWNIPTLTTISDKYEKEIKKLKFEHRQEMEGLKQELNDLRLADTMHYKAEEAESKRKYDERLKAQQKRYQEAIKRIRDEKNQRMADYKEYVRNQRITQKEAAERRALVNQITDTSKTLMDWMRKNNGKTGEAVPEVLKVPVSKLLNAIDFSSKQYLGLIGGSKAFTPTRKDISLRSAVESIRDMVTNIQNGQNTAEGLAELSTYVDFPPSYAEDLDNLFKTVNAIALRTGNDNMYILNEMSAEDLADVYNMVKIMKQTVQNLNKRIASANAASIATSAQNSILELKELGDKKYRWSAVEGAQKFLGWQNTLPIHAFKHMGNSALSYFEALQDGWDKFTFNVKEIIDYAKEAFTGEQKRVWSNTVKEYTVMVLPSEADANKGVKPFEETIKMTDAQLMSLYCLSKREHAIGHISKGGIVVGAFGEGKNKVVQNKNIRLSSSELEKLLSNLTEEQIKVADKLQAFMNGRCSDWGNEVTMKRYGIRGFTEKNYFPIKVDSNILNSENIEKEKSIYALLNMSFTKPLTRGASNQIQVDDIFSVFSKHTSEMAKYNSLALPVLDMIKWYNYKEKDAEGRMTTLKGTLKSVYGNDAGNYIMSLLEDVNGSQESGRDEELLSKATKRYKVASVAANLQVAALQPVSYVRLRNLMNPKYMAKGLTSNVKKGMEKNQKYSGIAVWKEMSLFDTNISKGLDRLISHDDTKLEKAIDASMKLAGIMDKVTWGCIWNACEAEIKDTTDLSDEAFNQAVAKRFREVVYKTQVVDSTLTRSQLMRSKSIGTQWATSFMSEPTVAINMLTDATFDFLNDRRKKGLGYAFKNNGKKILNASYVYILTAAVESVFRTLFTKYRDKDLEDDTLELLWREFLEQVNPLASLPLARDILSIWKGYDVNRPDMQGIQYLKWAVTGIEKNGLTYKTFYRLLQSISTLGGIPLSSAMREIEAFWNISVGNMYPELELNK